MSPDDRVPGGDLEADLQEVTGDLKAPTPAVAQQSLAYSLTAIVDGCRQIAVDLGVRPYRVWLVHLMWSGARRGNGVPEVISEVELTPVPRVRDLDGLRREVRAPGTVEEGDIVVDRISARYSEDTLLGRTPDIQDPQLRRTSLRQAEFFWEIQENRPGRIPPPRRRFSGPRTASLSRAGMSWRVVLTRQSGDRQRDGSTGRSDF